MEEKLEEHRAFLVERIDPDFGLLDKLRANKTLTREAVHKIKLKDNTTEEKNRILLDFILKDKKADELISALRDSGQTHLVNFLKAGAGYVNAFGDDWPLSESVISHLENNCESLMNLLNTSELCFNLYSEKVINDRQKQFISSKPIDADRNEALLDILIKFSIRQYKTTIACLNDCKQGHIAKLLSDGGVFVQVHANLECDVGNVDRLEDEIIKRFTKDLENIPSDAANRVVERIQERFGIVAARKGQSIVIYIHCTTNDELQQLIDQLKTDRLKEIIETIFREMLNIGIALRVALTWSVEEFQRAATYLGSDGVSLSGDLQSKLQVTEGKSLSTALVEDSRDGDLIRKSSKKRTPLGKISRYDASTKTDDTDHGPFMKRKTDWMAVEEATTESRILCSAETQTEPQHDYEDSCICGKNKECIDLRQKLEQALKEGDRLKKLLKEQRRKDHNEDCVAVNEELAQDQSENKKEMKKPIYQRQEDHNEGCVAANKKLEGEQSENGKQMEQTINQTQEDHNEGCVAANKKLEGEQSENGKQMEQTINQTQEVSLRSEYHLNSASAQMAREKAKKRENKWIQGLNREFLGLSENLSDVFIYDSLKNTFSSERRPTCNFDKCIGSSYTNKCLCVYKNERLMQLSSEIRIADPKAKIIGQWPMEDYCCDCLHHIDFSNIIDPNSKHIPGAEYYQADGKQKGDRPLAELRTYSVDDDNDDDDCGDSDDSDYGDKEE